MIKTLKKLILPALLSACFIVFTVIISEGDYSLTSFGRFCFLFNVIPSDIGFLQGDGLIVVVYYPILFVTLTLLFWWIGCWAKMLIQKLSFQRTK